MALFLSHHSPLKQVAAAVLDGSRQNALPGGSATSRVVPLENEQFRTMFCLLHFQSTRQTIANYNPYEWIICLAACGNAFM